MAALSEQYKQRWGVDPCMDADLVFFLGDRATYSRIWSAVSGKLPTYRRNPGKYWYPHARRWLLPVDKLASMGLPVTEATADMMGVPVLPVLDPKRASSIQGNAMHFSNIAVVLLLGLTCFGPNIEEPSIDWTALARAGY